MATKSRASDTPDEPDDGEPDEPDELTARFLAGEIAWRDLVAARRAA